MDVPLLARTVRGIEWVAAAEVAEKLEPIGLREGHRELRFSLPELVSALLTLGTVDDLFLVVAEAPEADHRRAALAGLGTVARTIDLDRAMAEVARLRPVAGRTVDVVGSFVGRRNYSRHEIEDVVGEALSGETGWRYLSRTTGAPAVGALSLRVHIVDSTATFAVRLAASPLHRRSYRLRSVPGGLHPPLARALGLLAGLDDGMSLLDPFAGSGTIVIEAMLASPRVRGFGFDVDPEAVAIATTNGDAAGVAASFARADAASLPVDTGSVDRVATNPAWGTNVQLQGSLRAVADELERVLSREGRAALLLPPEHELRRHLSGFEEVLETRVRVSGALADLVVVRARDGARSAPRPGAPGGTA